MTQFWLAAFCLVILALGLLIPLFRSKGNAKETHVDQAALNKGIYRERLAELKTELAQGEVDQANFDSMVKELQSSLFDDVSGVDAIDADVKGKAAKEKHGVALAVAALLLVVAPVVWYWQFGAHQQVTHWQQVHAQLQDYIQRGVMQQGEPLSESEMRDFALALRTELQVKPTDDATVWLLLGRIGMAIGDGELAMESMERAYEMAPTNPSVALGYAQVAHYSDDPNVTHRGARILDALIAHNPENLDALSLKAFQAFERGEHQAARTIWLKMSSLLDDADPRKATIERTLAMLDAQLAGGAGEGAGEVHTNPHAQALQDTPPEQPAANAPAEKAPSGQELSVIVKLAPELRESLPSSGNLVVFARAKEGPPLPLAVKRLPIGNFPVKVVLSDSDAMMPEMKLSSFPEVYVTARVSKDQDVRLSAGELEGIGDALSLNGEPQNTTVVISTKH
ncbi:c-type cytochrome biogenesis protein CcmI [Corallincola platygyrae]|uniref:C-type cytochrome biogenesis protein CcmI n=1 Tax=Corallincola platygyrae TaxID=1193278 RepID=A0ABW4XL99_9GAMM